MAALGAIPADALADYVVLGELNRARRHDRARGRGAAGGDRANAMGRA
jgi:hypothetical protein